MNEYMVTDKRTNQHACFVKADSKFEAVTKAATRLGIDPNAEGSALHFFMRYEIKSLLDCVAEANS